MHNKLILQQCNVQNELQALQKTFFVIVLMFHLVLRLRRAKAQE